MAILKSGGFIASTGRRRDDARKTRTAKFVNV
jgi:hypothetical protein